MVESIIFDPALSNNDERVIQIETALKSFDIESLSKPLVFMEDTDVSAATAQDIVGSVRSIEWVDGKAVATIRIDDTPIGQSIQNLLDGGVSSTTDIKFIPNAVKFVDENNDIIDYKLTYFNIETNEEV